MRQLMLTGLLLLLSNAASAMKWGELEQEIRSVEAGEPANTAIIQRFGELVEGVVIYTRALNERGSSPRIFCTSGEQAVHLNELVSLVREQARQQRAEGTEPVVRLLLQGLARRHPCPREAPETLRGAQ